MTDSPLVSRPGGSGVLANRTVARIGYGAMQLPRLQEDEAGAIALVRQAIDLGVNHIDTAQFYGNGFSNSVIRQTLRTEDDVVVATKVGATPAPGGPRPMRLAQRPEELRASVEDNLRSLGTETLDLVNLRRTDSATGQGLQASGEQVVDLDDQLSALTTLRDQGKIRAIGLSSVSRDVVRRALPAGIACVQNAYSLLSREDEDLLRLCTDEDIAWVPYFPLGSAFPHLPKVTDEAVVREVAASLGVTASQIGLAWLLHHAPNTFLIPGTASAEHLAANVAVGAITLDQETLSRLDAVQPGV